MRPGDGQRLSRRDGPLKTEDNAAEERRVESARCYCYASLSRHWTNRLSSDDENSRDRVDQ